MEEGSIRAAAQMYALVAEMHAIVARIKGMEIENRFAGMALYDKYDFDKASQDLYGIAHALRTEN